MTVGASGIAMFAFNSPDGIPIEDMLTDAARLKAFNSPDGILEIKYWGESDGDSFNSPDGIRERGRAGTWGAFWPFNSPDGIHYQGFILHSQ